MKSRIKFILCLSVVLFAAAVCRAQKPELVVRTGHSTGISSVAFSPDGKTLATCADTTIRFWDVATGREVRTITFSDTVNSLAFSPDGRTLVSTGWDKMIKLTETSTGRELRTLTGHSSWVIAVTFSPDGKTIASGSSDKTIKLWDSASGRELLTLNCPSGVNSVAFSSDGKTLAGSIWDHPVTLWHVATGRQLRTLAADSRSPIAFTADGKTLASGSVDDTIKLWDMATGQVLRTIAGNSGDVWEVVFSPDGKTLASGWGDVTTGDENTIKLWEVATGRELLTLAGQSSFVTAVAFSPDGKTLAGNGVNDKSITLWEVPSGRVLREFAGHTSYVTSVALSVDGKILAAGNHDHTIKLWDIATARELRTLTGHSWVVDSVAFSPDARILASCSVDHTIKLWDVATGRELRTLTGHDEWVDSIAFSPDGKTLASTSIDRVIKLWDVATGRELRTLGRFDNGVHTVTFSPDGKTLAVGGHKIIQLWDAATGRPLRTLSGHNDYVVSIAFSADGKILASGSWDNTIKLWDVATSQHFRTLQHSRRVLSVAVSNDGKTLASGGWEESITLWDIATGSKLRTFVGHSRRVESVGFSPDSIFLVSGSEDATTRLWRVETGELLATLIALDDHDWAVVTPDGRFDASSNAQKLMHWMVGNEPIELEQLKERYYEPGLLAKLTGFNTEPLRDVSALRDVKLFPAVDYQLAGPKGTKLSIKLTNRGGGIGPVQVFVNDKELIADARTAGFNPNQAQANLTVDLSRAPAIPGQVNEIRVVARNQEGYLSSRGTKLEWTPAGSVGAAPPTLYAIVVGTSTYASPALDLRYAAKDAADMALALELGAKRLFGAERVHLQLLSTDRNNPRATPPTKANISKAFEQVMKARPQDIFVIYFSGHGVTLQQGKDSYLYLTQEARTTDSAKLADPGVRAQTTISSEELVEWIKRVPALKQVMILDTCAAGAAARKLIEQRNVSGDQIRAIERLKDRTGFHVLMGSAADAVSYEASQYGQGVLTYALLQGMRGAALREEEYVDVQKLFQYAADEVPQLARNIGGLQRPLVAAPRGTSFDVGRIGRDEKALIPLTTIKPVILRPVLLNAEEQADTLDLSRELRKRLREESYVLVRSSGRQPLIVYVDEDELPGAIRPSGTYSVSGDQVRVTMVLRRDGQNLATLPIEGTKNDVPGLIDKVVQAISAAISKSLP